MDRVCVIEDDPTIRQFVGEKLKSLGYSVDTFESADPLMRKPEPEMPWDLYIVDVLLPGSSGFDLCERLKKLSPTIPILILSALSEPSDRIEGLKKGADDYLTKPFEMEELLLRVRGMLKRRSWYRKLPQDCSIHEWDDNRINFVTFQASHAKETFMMSQKECMLMKLLIEREGEVISRDEILDQVWGYHVFPSTRTVDNFILRLRKYFERNPKKPRYLHSVRGLGYRFAREN